MPGLGVAVQPDRPPHCDVWRYRGPDIRVAVQLDVIPSQCPGLLGPDPGAALASAATSQTADSPQHPATTTDQHHQPDSSHAAKPPEHCDPAADVRKQARTAARADVRPCRHNKKRVTKAVLSVRHRQFCR